MLTACSANPDPLSVEGPTSFADDEQATFELSNTSGAVLDWTVEIRNDSENPSPESWFTVSEKAGRLEPENQTKLVLSLIDDLTDGEYKAEIDILYTGETTTFEILAVVGEDDRGGATITGTITTDNSLISAVPAASTQQGEILDEVLGAAQVGYVPGQLLVKYAEPVSTQSVSSAAQWAQVHSAVQTQYGLSVLEHGAVGQVQRVAVGAQDVLELADTLSADSRIRYAEPVYYLHTTELPNDELIQKQWWLASAGVPAAWNAETGESSDVVVAVMDSGFDLEHPELSGRFLDGIDFCAQIAQDSCSVVDDDPSFGNSENSHGTHVAGIIGAAANNEQGIAGVAHGSGIKLLPVKIFDDAGEGATTLSFVNGIRWAAGLEININGVTYQNPNPADIINMSLGGFFDSEAIKEAVAEARAAGATLLAATGNNGIDQIISPAAVEDVIAVGSVNPSFRRSCFSNYGTGAELGPGKIDLVVAGGEGPATRGLVDKELECDPDVITIESTYPNNSYGVKAGTSMATPIASGIAALILARRPELKANLLEDKLLESVYFDDSYMTEEEYGAGILRADYALDLPGPDAEVSVTTSKNDADFIDTVKLDLLGGSTSYILDGLAAGTYDLEALTGGSGAVLGGRAELAVKTGEEKRLDIPLKAQ